MLGEGQKQEQPGWIKDQNSNGCFGVYQSTSFVTMMSSFSCSHSERMVDIAYYFSAGSQAHTFMHGILTS